MPLLSVFIIWLEKRMNGLKCKKKKKAMFHWNSVFSGSEAYMLVLGTFLLIYLFSSIVSGQITEQDSVRQTETNFKPTRKHM